MSVLVGTQEVLKLHNKEAGKARPANREQSAVEGCPRAAYGCIGGLLQTTPCIDWPGHLPGGRQLGSWQETGFEEMRSQAFFDEATFPPTGLHGRLVVRAGYPLEADLLRRIVS
jgi:hypothetical protein